LYKIKFVDGNFFGEFLFFILNIVLYYRECDFI